MPTTQRQQIIDRIKTKLALITVANGYNSNAGSDIFEWLTNEEIDATMCPCTTIEDGDGTIEEQSGSMSGMDMQSLSIKITITQLSLVSRETAAAAARLALADISKVLRDDIQIPVLGGLASRVIREAVPIQVWVTGDGYFSAGQINATIKYKTKFMDEVQ